MQLKAQCSPGVSKFSELAAFIHSVPRAGPGGAHGAAGGGQHLPWAEVNLKVKMKDTRTDVLSGSSDPHSEGQGSCTDSAGGACLVGDGAGVNCKEPSTEASTISICGAGQREHKIR